MKIRNGLITVSFYFVVSSLSGCGLAYETDLTEEEAFFCPGYANCTGMDCLYNRMSPTSDWKIFNKTEKATMTCDSLAVEFNFPETKDVTFAGNESWICFRYYDAVQHHFAIAKITLNKPSEVKGDQVNCKTSIGSCTLFNETSSEVTFIAGLPSTCVKWADEELLLPSKTETFECLLNKNCTGDDCHFHRTSSKTSNKNFLTNDDSIIRCDPLKVDIFYPNTNYSNFTGMENFTCFKYANDNGTSFSVVEINMNKPDDVNGSQITCSVEPSGNQCTQQKDTSSQLLFVAGLPVSCSPWVPPPAPDTERFLPSDNQTVDCPEYFKNCSDEYCHFNGTYIDKINKPFIAGTGAYFDCGSLNVEILFPSTSTKNSYYIGNNTQSCFKYKNGNGTAFNVVEMILTKPEDVKGSQVICTFDGKKCTVLNETTSEVTLVAGFQSSCTPWNPPTPPPPVPERTTAGSDKPSSSEPTTTGGTDTTTGGTPGSTTQGSSTTTSSPGKSTTAKGTTGSSDSTTAEPATKEGSNSTSAAKPTTKAGSNSTSAVARLEFAAVMVMITAPFVRHYL